ncbi:hypothetical protein ACFL10_01310 [Patescibacteria group bacterium]
MEKKINYPKLIIKSLLKSFILLLFIYYSFIFAVTFEEGGAPSSMVMMVLLFPFYYFIEEPSVIWSLRGPTILFYAFGLIIFVKDLKKLKNANA